MTFTLEQLSLAYPHQIWVEFSEQEQLEVVPAQQDYSHEAAQSRAYINSLCLKTLLPIIAEEANLRSVESIQVFPNQEDLPSVWEFVNGTAINIKERRIVIIPNIAFDTDQLCVEQEWVDIPEWAGDYYLPVQVNLDDGWLRVWGFTTHEILKTKGKYDPSDRTYCLDAEDVFEEMNSFWISLSMAKSEKAAIQPLPSLSPSQIDRFFSQLSQPSFYSPRLKVPFTQWGAILASDKLRKELKDGRLGEVKEPVFGQILTQKIFSEIWLSIEELMQTMNLNSMLFRNAPRSSNREPHPLLSEISRGRAIDLGIQLSGHPVALIVNCRREAEDKCNILLQVYPGGGHPYLPPEVQLIVLDDTGEIFLEAKSRKADNWIQLEFTGEPGERFSVKVALGDASIREDFAI